MRLLQKLGLVKQDETTTQQQTVAPVQKQAQSYTPPAPISIAQTDYHAHMMEVMAEADLPGADFREYFNACMNPSLSSQPDAQKYPTIYAGFKALGVTPAKLVADSAHYLKAIAADAANFNNQMAAAVKTEVTNKNDEAARLTAENEELNQKIQANLQRATELRNAAFAAQQELANEATAFEQAKTHMEATVANVVQNIQQHLNG